MRVFLTCLVLFVIAHSAFSQSPFVTTWQTTASGESITIPTKGGGYDFTVDWGDGSVENNLTGNATHSYASPGIYTVSVSGDFPQIYFNSSGDKDKVLTVEQWGDTQWRSMSNAFAGCTNLNITNSSIDSPDLSGVTDMTRMFYGATSFNGDVASWDVSAVNKLNRAFSLATNFDQDIGNWDVSSVTTFNNMFDGASAFNQDLSAWNTSSATKMTQMFRNATAFDQSLALWDVQHVTHVADMFKDGNLSTANYDATLSGWASQPALQSGVNFKAAGLKFCTAEADRQRLIDDFGWVFTGDKRTGNCHPEDIFITTWLTTTANESITIPTNGGGYDYTVDWGDGTLVEDLTGDATHTFATAGVHTIQVYGDFPQIFFNNEGDKDKILTIEQWGALQWRSMSNAFAGCTNLNITNPSIDSPDLSGVTDMTRMFNDATSFNGDITGWDVSTIKKFNRTFSGAITFNQPLGVWDVSSAESMIHMFSYATSFDQPLFSWNVSSVSLFNNMFDGAMAFNQDLSGWNMVSATKLNNMFRTATAFDQSLGDWNIQNVTHASDMFRDGNLSTANYDATLSGWAAQPTLQANVNFKATGLKFCVAEADRQKIIDDFGWVFTGDKRTGNCHPEDIFITTWRTTTDNESITIPTRNGGYDYSVDWGDGSLDENITGDASHTFATAGVHTIQVYGDFPQIYFNNSGDKDKILTIEQWGGLQWRSMSNAFAGCTNLNITNPTIDSPDLSGVTDMTRMFYAATAFNGNVTNWDLSTVTKLTRTFSEAANFNQAIGGWNVSNVTLFTNMFDGATSFNQDLSAWNTASATKMNQMFRDAIAFDQSLGQWNMQFVTHASEMFRDGNLSTSNYDATLSGWAAQPTLQPGVNFKATGLEFCASEVDRQKIIDDFGWIFTGDAKEAGCVNTKPFITTWETTAASESITIPTKGEGYNYSVDWGDGIQESNLTGDATHTYEDAGVHDVSINGEFPQIHFNNEGDKDKILTVEQWGDVEWTSMENAFSGCSKLNITNPEIDSPDLTLVTSTNNMFSQATAFDGEIGAWDVSNVSTMDGMFSNAASFNADISEWDVSGVTQMDDMFEGAASFDQPLGDWNLSSLEEPEIVFNESGLSVTSYDATLRDWVLLGTAPANATLQANGLTYCGSEAYRQTLIDDYGWTIIGDAPSATCNDKPWQLTFGGTSSDTDVHTLRTNDGGFLVSTSSKSGIGGTKTTANRGGWDWWTFKVDSEGNIEWEIDLGNASEDGQRTRSLQTQDGHYLMAGHIISDETDQINTPSKGARDIFLIKVSADDQSTIWQARLGGNSNDIPYDLVEMPNGDIVVGGYTTSTDIPGHPNMGSLDLYVARLNAQGSLLWEQTHGGNNFESADRLIASPNGGVYIGGYTRSTDLGNINNGDFDYWLMELDANGDMLWDKLYGGGALDAIRAIALDGNGNIIVAGESYSSAGGTKSEASYGKQDMWVVKTTSQGDLIWEKTLGAAEYEMATDIQVLPNNELIVGGYSNSPVQGMRTATHYGGLDFWLLRLTTDGALTWQTSFGGSGSDGGFELVAYDEDSQHLTFTGEFSQGQSGTITEAGYGSSDPLIVNMGIAQPRDFYAIGSGDWNDGAIWSLAPGGPPVNEVPDETDSVEIDGFEVQLSGNAQCSSVKIGRSTSTKLWVNGPSAHLVVFGDVLMVQTAVSGQSVLSVNNGGRLECR